MRRALLAVLLLVVAGVAAAAGAGFALHQEAKRAGPLSQTRTLVLQKHERTREIGRDLRKAGIVRSQWAFAAQAGYDRLRHRPGLKAGEYAFAPGESLRDVIGEIEAGRVVVHRLTVPEGWTNRQIAALIAAEPALSGDTGPLPGEGGLWPETYSFTLGDSRAGVVKRMHEAAAHALEQAWAARDPALPLKTPAEALVMASLVERETGVKNERARVAAVFYNRLKAGMKLQSDPTVIYILSDGLGVLDRPLGHGDLALQSPYNTYANAGLPPGPICNPGKASLDAALHPDADAYLYFVATGHGGHAFAATLQDHNRNVASYVRALHEKQSAEAPAVTQPK